MNRADQLEAIEKQETIAKAAKIVANVKRDLAIEEEKRVKWPHNAAIFEKKIDQLREQLAKREAILAELSK